MMPHPRARFDLHFLSWAALAGAFCQPMLAGTVYLVVGSDTAIWNAGGTVDVYTRHPYYRQDSFTMTNAPIFQVMDPAWREQFKDSFGQPIKFTWWMMGGNIYRDASNLNVPLPNTMTLHLMKQYHGAALRQFGDELSLHYHTYLWSDYNGSGVFYWNQARSFDQCRADFDATLAAYLLEEEVFPVSFRSGWHYMDRDWQQHLDELIPYCFHDNYPAKLAWYTNTGPIAGVEDWSRAPSVFVPFHPSTNDYQVPGDGPGWNVRSVKIQSLSQTLIDQMFGEAAAGGDQVACFWDHLPENFTANIARLGSLLTQAVSTHPTVRFRYCTALEAMQAWRGLTNRPLPQLNVTQDLQGPTVSLRITSSVPIFQARPFVCLRDAYGQYRNVTDACQPTGTNAWTVDLGSPSNLLAKVAVAVTDNAGNLATKTLRYLPDDLYLDNLDPQYSESQGNWTSTTNGAWGTDARLAAFESNTTASASWGLPLSWPGRYRFAVQVPFVARAATNVEFDLLAADTNVLSVILPAGIPTNQWAFLASAVIDPTVSNRVEMVVDGTNQLGACAVADVLRVTPAPAAAASPPSLQGGIRVATTPLGLRLTWSGRAKVHYTLQRSAALTGPWSAVELLSPESPQVLEYLAVTPAGAQEFYRLLEQ